MGLFAERAGLIDTENAFKIGPLIRGIEEQGKEVVKCNLGEPDFPIPEFIKDEVKGSSIGITRTIVIPRGFPHCGPPLQSTSARHVGSTQRPNESSCFPGLSPPSDCVSKPIATWGTRSSIRALAFPSMNPLSRIWAVNPSPCI